MNEDGDGAADEAERVEEVDPAASVLVLEVREGLYALEAGQEGDHEVPEPRDHLAVKAKREGVKASEAHGQSRSRVKNLEQHK